MKRLQKVNHLIIVLLCLFLTFSFTLIFPHGVNKGSLGYVVSWLFGATLVIGSFISYAVFWLKKSTDRPIDADKYQIIAVIPAYNEEQTLLDATIYSILNQSVAVKEIHVVDDGSDVKVEKLDHPAVFYHYQSNRGKRYAQKKALDAVNPLDFNYILAVDSDSILGDKAIEQLVQSIKQDPAVKACTGVVLTRNRQTNIITQIADLNIGITCLLGRPIRSLLGALETTSGALALYDSHIVYQHLEEYVLSGTYSDDRQLCLYSLLYGKAVGVSEAVVYSEMPTTMKQTANQRFRWAKGSWKALPFQLKYLTAKQLIFPLLGLLYLLTVPFLVVYILYMLVTGQNHFLWLYLYILLGVRYFQAVLYLLANPTFTKKELFRYLALIIPLEFLFYTTILVYLKYKALFHLKDTDWLTRAQPAKSE